MKKGPENRKNEVKLRPSVPPLKHSVSYKYKYTIRMLERKDLKWESRLLQSSWYPQAFTVVHKNITYIKNNVANYFLARLQLQLHK